MLLKNYNRPTKHEHEKSPSAKLIYSLHNNEKEYCNEEYDDDDDDGDNDDDDDDDDISLQDLL